MICKLHGYTKSIISDQDLNFINQFRQILFHLNETTLQVNTTYHRQTDGKTKVLNGSLQQYIHSFVHEKPTDWLKYLHWAYGVRRRLYPALPVITPSSGLWKNCSNYFFVHSRTTTIEAMEITLIQRDTILQLLLSKLLKAQRKMKSQADKHHLMWLLTLVTGHTWNNIHINKCLSRTFGLKSCQIVTMGLFRYYKSLDQWGTNWTFPPLVKYIQCLTLAYLNLIKETLAFLRHQFFLLTSSTSTQSYDPHHYATSNKTEMQVLVQWKGLPSEEATWKDFNDLEDKSHTGRGKEWYDYG